MASISGNPERNIVFFGETGTGKSSAINLLLGTGTSANVSNDSKPCTEVTASYKTTQNGTRCTLWDTRGLSEGRSLLGIFGIKTSAEKELKKTLKERHQRRQIDLLVYCVRGSRATGALVRYYNDFCTITHQLAAPVAILVTHLERESSMEDWWDRNSPHLKEFKMEFDDHVCITTLQGHVRTAESKKKLIDLITKKRRWQAQRSGSYFGSSAQISTPSAPPRRGLIQSLFKKTNDKGPNFGPNKPAGTSAAETMSRSSSYGSPGSSAPPSPVIEPPTPSSEAPTVKVAHSNPPGADGPSQPSSAATYSTGSSRYSMFTGPHSSNTSHSDAHLQSCTGESEDHLMNELPFKHSNATIRRTTGYATRQGSFGDIWECTLISGESSRMVAVKAVKLCTNDRNNIESHEKKLRRELRIWGGLQHQNIVPLLGIVSGFGPLPSMVSPWFHNGSLSTYLSQNRTSMSAKHRLLWDIATGLSYLHSHNVVHGDLHSDNVLINDDGKACLTDFGLSLVNEFVGTSYLNSSICGAVQFADPALVQRVCKSRDVFYPSQPCDVYSFGGLILHVLSGKKPYDGLPPHGILPKVLEGERPDIPTEEELITPWHKWLIQKCWEHAEHKRPSAESLVAKFAQR